jgi:hypothetical protein
MHEVLKQRKEHTQGQIVQINNIPRPKTGARSPNGPCRLLPAPSPRVRRHCDTAERGKREKEGEMWRKSERIVMR